MCIRKPFFRTPDTGRSGIEARADAPVPETNRTCGIREWTLTAKFQQTSFFTEFRCKDTLVQIVAIYTTIVNGSAKKQLEPSQLVELFRLRHPIEENLCYRSDEPVGMAGTARNVNHRSRDSQSCVRVRHSNTTGGIRFGRRQTA